MKKINFLLVSLIAIFLFKVDVFAASASLSVSSSSVYVGDSFTVTANVNSAAAWNIHVSASGLVSGCSINQADATADAMDTNKSFSATCTATGTGTITITLSGDVTSASDGNAVNVSESSSVTVSIRPAPAPVPAPTPVPTPTPTPSINGNNGTNNTDTRSKNNNIKELSVEGYELVKLDNNNYTLSVSNDVTSINIKASAEDSKSKVVGAGNHDINVGENNIEVVVTAENGSQNKINIKVTRKDGYYLEDLDSALKNNKTDDINVIIKSDTKITTKDLEKIKSSGKVVKFNYYNDDKKLVYSWIIDGSKLKNTGDLVTTVINDSENKKDILRLSNYADGLFFGLKQTNNLLVGSGLKLFVGNKYKDDEFVNVYSYVQNNDKLELVKSKVKVLNGYVEFDVTDASDYFVTMSTISSLDMSVTTTGKSFLSSTILLIIIGILSLLLIVLLILLILKWNKNTKNNNNSFDSTFDIKNDLPIVEQDFNSSSNNIFNDNQNNTVNNDIQNNDVNDINLSNINYRDYDGMNNSDNGNNG